MVPSTFVLLSILGAAYGAANDWSQPCLSGVCFYDLPTSGGSAASGTLKIWGSEEAITDITSAAGWNIIDCQKDALSQDIRLVCTGADDQCAHLYKNIGAVGKIARLPESCGQNAFAHISKAWVPEDQSIPEDIARRLVKRDGVQPQVKALRIDTDFSAVDATKIGTVNFAIQAANVPGADVAVPSFSRARERRQFGFVKKAISAVTSLNTVSIDQSQMLPPVSVDKTFNVLDEKLSCPPTEGSLKIDVTAKADAVAAIGVAAEGTIIPPKISDFAITTTLTADLNGAVTLNGSLSGSIESEKINLFEIGIPGLSFPGILTIGPSFRIDAQASADLDVNAELTVGLNYKVDKATLVFPPQSHHDKSGGVKLKHTPLKLSVSPSAKITGSVTAHLIPSLNLGISALGGVADATVFLELDASATMELSLEAQASATISRGVQPRAGIASRPGLPAFAVRDTSVDSLKLLTEVAERRVEARHSMKEEATTSSDASFSGCFAINAGLGVNAGANADFFGLFDAETKVPLFNRDFELFKRCFGSQPQRRALRFNRALDGVPPSAGSLRLGRASLPLERRALACPASDTQLQANLPLVDEIVDATSIKPL